MPNPAEPGPIRYDPDGFDAPSAQIAMLNDVTRTRALLRAIRDTVRPGDVVLDIGSGTGILAVAAAKAGARRVYAIEQGHIGRAAREMIEANGVGDIVTLIRGRSTQIELPERADVLVSEILGADPLDERVLEVFLDARARLLKPDAAIVPRGVTVWGLPVEVPADFAERTAFLAKDITRWRHLYGIDFTGLAGYAGTLQRHAGVMPQEAATWPMLAEPVHLTSLSFDGEITLAGYSTASFVAEQAAVRLGMVVFFDVELSPGVVITTDPARVPDHNHWGCRVWRFPEKPSVEAGERVTVAYVHDHDEVEVRLVEG